MIIGEIMVFELLFCFLIKHFIADFPLQSFPFQYKNKGTYGHPGGLLHAGIHFLLTSVILLLFVDVPVALSWAIIDGFIHYHIDYVKMNVNDKFKLKPDNSEMFWVLLGLDQLLHGLTYLFITHQIVTAETQPTTMIIAILAMFWAWGSWWFSMYKE